VIIAVVKQNGFSDRWINRMQSILTIGTPLVLLNGVPDKVFYYRRGYGRVIHFPTVICFGSTSFTIYILPLSLNICRPLVHFLLKNDKHLEMQGVVNKDC
jgi:hypothetical protein